MKSSEIILLIILATIIGFTIGIYDAPPVLGGLVTVLLIFYAIQKMSEDCK